MTTKTITIHDAAEQAANEAEDMAREAAGLAPLVGLPDIEGAVRRALESESADVPCELIAQEEIRAGLMRQPHVAELVATLGALIRTHPELGGLSAQARIAQVQGDNKTTAKALRALVRGEILARTEVLIRRYLVDYLEAQA